MNETFKISDFVFEMLSFPYSKDYFDILVENTEFGLRCMYVENMLVKSSLEEDLAESGAVLPEGYFQESCSIDITEFTEDGVIEVKGTNIFGRIWDWLKKTWRKFFLGVKRIFNGIKDIDPSDEQKFREALKNNSWDKEAIDKAMAGNGLSEQFWIEQPISITDPDVQNLTFASNVSKVKQSCFKKFCQLVLTKEPIRLNANELTKVAMQNKDQQQAFAIAKANGKVRPTSWEAITNFFSGAARANSSKELEDEWKKYVEQQHDIEINGIMFQFSKDAMDKNIQALNAADKSVQELTSSLKEVGKKASSADPNATIEVPTPDGKTKKMKAKEAREYSETLVDKIKDIGPQIAYVLTTLVAVKFVSAAGKKFGTELWNDFKKKRGSNP